MLSKKYQRTDEQNSGGQNGKSQIWYARDLHLLSSYFGISLAMRRFT
jgi:hypothetical protein